MALEGMAMRTAYREILAQASRASDLSAQDSREASSNGQLSEWRRIFGYIREGNDVMSVATFCEAGSGVLGAAVGLVGIGLSWYLQTILCDLTASLVMSSMVGIVSVFLLRRSGDLLLGKTLPQRRVEHLVICLEDRPAIVNVYDVKTEVIGTDTVRFKAEVQFNSQALTERLLGMRRRPVSHQPQDSDEEVDPAATADPTPKPAPPGLEQRSTDGDVSQTRRSPRTRGSWELELQMQKMLPRLQEGLPEGEDAAKWLIANNSLFYEAMAWELKKAERMLRNELKDFRNVHIDLEPW
eukprot:gnl/TRDRNA2_/TRDRNA2_160944_c0_seq1.p1 gnl/TRDRNA2_/TRDRNA2_160944_c0~~gnl/TRDRNA2_/TRDRNA2_160944_c0_seq1.p1  ORF type:complete len:348 (-),score=74.49 gnl/TRDRNA2_/TRDRNA2_160944_c0_seq1:73-963(-)